MALDLTKERGIPLERQVFTWRELVQPPYSKLDDDAFTRVRVILMNGIETEALRFGHACARMNRELQRPLARVRRIEQHQQTLVNWLNPADQSPLETTIGYEQVAIEVTASIGPERAGPVPGPGLPLRPARGLRSHVPLLRRCSIGSRARTPTTSCRATPTCCRAARPRSSTAHPLDDLRDPYDRAKAAAAHQAQRPDPDGRRAPDPRLLHERRAAVQPIRWRASCTPRSPPSRSSTSPSTSRSSTPTRPGWRSGSCTRRPRSTTTGAALEQESNPRIKAIWERFLDYELGQLSFVRELIRKTRAARRRRGAAGRCCPTRSSSRASESSSGRRWRGRCVARVGDRVRAERRRARAKPRSIRKQMNRDGSPSEGVAQGYMWRPGTELRRRPALELAQSQERRLQ